MDMIIQRKKKHDFMFIKYFFWMTLTKEFFLSDFDIIDKINSIFVPNKNDNLALHLTFLLFLLDMIPAFLV